MPGGSDGEGCWIKQDTRYTGGQGTNSEKPVGTFGIENGKIKYEYWTIGNSGSSKYDETRIDTQKMYTCSLDS